MVKKVFRLTYVEPNHQSASRNQGGATDLQRLIWIFWVCLSPTWYNSDCSQLMSQFGHWSTWLWSIIQREISSTKLRKPLLTCSISHSTFSIHRTNPFLCFSGIFTFLEITKHNYAKSVAFFLPSSILKWLHKNSPILISFFKMHVDISLFQMKLKTTKKRY